MLLLWQIFSTDHRETLPSFTLNGLDYIFLIFGNYKCWMKSCFVGGYLPGASYLFVSNLFPSLPLCTDLSAPGSGLCEEGNLLSPQFKCSLPRDNMSFLS